MSVTDSEELFTPVSVGGSKLSLLKVPAWLSQRWAEQQEGSVVGHLDENSFTLAGKSDRAPSGTAVPSGTRFDLVRRAVDTLYCFRREDDLHVVELVDENITIRPSIADNNYRTFLHNRNQQSSAATRKHRTAHACAGALEDQPSSSSAPLLSRARVLDGRSNISNERAPIRPVATVKRPHGDLAEIVCEFLESKGVGQSYKAILGHTKVPRSELDQCLAQVCDLRPIREGSGQQGYFVKKRHKRVRTG